MKCHTVSHGFDDPHEVKRWRVTLKAKKEDIEVNGDFVPQVLSLQRPPEFVVWQLPKDKTIALVTICDGFVSKAAVPTPDRIAQCLSDPYRYMVGDFYKKTVFEYLTTG